MRRGLSVAAAAALTALGACGIHQDREAALQQAADRDLRCKTAREKLSIFEPAAGIYRTAQADKLRAEGFGPKLDEDERWLMAKIASTKAQRDADCPKEKNP